MILSILKNLEGHGVLCHMDDLLIYEINKKEHQSRVREVLQRLKDAGITLNEKCKLFKQDPIIGTYKPQRNTDRSC